MEPDSGTPATPRERTRAGRILDRLLDTDPVVRAMVLALPVIKLVGVVSATPSIYPDTKTYRHQGHWFDLSLSSMNGRSVRPVGATFWLAMWPNDGAIMVAQVLLAAVAWGALALVVSHGIRRPGVRRLFVALLVLIPCTAQIANWETVILGDSIAMTTGVLALASLIWLTREPSWGRALLFLPLALWYTMTRPNLFVVLLAWAAGLALVALLSKKVVLLGTVAGLLVLFSGYSYVYNMNSDSTWTQKNGYSRSTVGMAYPMGTYDPVATKVLADLRTSDAPKCMIPATPATVTDRGTTSWVATTVKTCPGMNEWATEHWQSWWIHWLLTHPGSTVQVIKSQLPHSLVPSVWGDVTAATPPPLAGLFFGTPALPQDAFGTHTYRSQPLILWAAAAVILAVAATRRRLWRRSPWGVDVILVATVGGGLATAISSGLLIQTVPHEVAQESLGATVVITAALVAEVGLAWDRLSSHTRDDVVGQHEPVESP
ncbi:hypothetical protein ABEG17_09125 [Pedococcus sp. KACC 23699]|uniref:Uncharacterized protein n=1 Tax=Pedococcus sp. KACC 23699 TaxID=3149228 RepID=A0AAU7JZ04_9MICO